MSIVGRSDVQLEVGRVFGKEIPYILLYIPKSNQAYSFQPTSFNTMNFIEFVTDKYVRLNVQHFFDGFVFNRIPLLRKLKLKEVISFKGIYGGLDDANDPRLPENGHMLQFNQNELGQFITTSLEPGKPFIEYGIGVYNIFRFLRLDLIKRVNYLDRPNVEQVFGVTGLGIRGRVKVEF
ncbi:MAG: carboxypeptidase-like regulatory domain-containing protein, partial [Bacteroidia bacterium]|nr:carboxypeptidase-like regulatory domain-containing protein [Bacteroidia bacterium]